MLSPGRTAAPDSIQDTNAPAVTPEVLPTHASNSEAMFVGLTRHRGDGVSERPSNAAGLRRRAVIGTPSHAALQALQRNKEEGK